MRLYPEKLASHLQQQLLPVYIVSGDETLLVDECCDQIRKQARVQGCTDREVIDAGAAKFDWQGILQNASSMSLFAERKLVELRLPSGKPGAEGSKALCKYLEICGAEDVLLIVAGKIDKQSTNSKWYKALDGAGASIQVWPVDAKDLPRWLAQRISHAGMSIEQEALQLLCDRVEGNLLAAVQEVEKLKLVATEGKISTRAVTESVANNARYNLFDMADNALNGNTAGSLKMLHGLRGEGTEASVALWALVREVRTLYQVQLACDQGQSQQQALSAHRVWNNRMGLMQSALSRHTRDSLAALLEHAFQTDGSIKGFAPGKPWDNLEQMVLQISTGA